MLANLHFLRPLWFFAMFPLILLGVSILQQQSSKKTWQSICDRNLLPYLLREHGHTRKFFPFSMIIGSGFFMVIALSGPTWSKIEMPTYQQIQPRVILLDMSEEMLNNDISPNRLARAKFKLHDLLSHRDAGQFGLIAYTGEPFVVSPLTEDSQTIDILLPDLNPDVLPVDGNSLKNALNKAQSLFNSSSTNSGDVLVLTSTIPSNDAVKEASNLARFGLRVSIIPMLMNNQTNVYFQPLAKAGNGKVITLSNDDSDINKWLKFTNIKSTFQINDMQNIPLWRDEGRWFILISLLLQLPVFWRGWLQRISA